MNGFDPDEALKRLLAARRLLGEIGGDERTLEPPDAIAERYRRTSSLARRRFDRLAGEAARAAAAGVERLMVEPPVPRAAGARILARALDRELSELLRLVS